MHCQGGRGGEAEGGGGCMDRLSGSGYVQYEALTKKIGKWITSPEEFPEHIFWITECKACVEVVAIGIMPACS